MSVITITGANDFMRSSEIRKLVSGFVAQYSELALERIDGEEVTFERIREALTSLPFLTNKKMVVLNRPSANTQFVEQAEALLAALPSTTELLLVEPKFDKRGSLYKLLKKQSDFREYNQLEGSQLTTWLIGRAKANGATISSADARYLAERVGQNQQLLSNELDKLALYQPAITRQTIDELTEKAPQSTIFELIEAAFAGKRQRALELYDEQRRLKVEPIQIIAMLAWQLHVLALVCVGEGRSVEAIAKEAKLNTFTVNKTQRLASRLSLGVVRQNVDRLATIDQRSKREALDLDEALRNYILQLHTT
jgi:DNA polymerase-3 subunit delta